MYQAPVSKRLHFFIVKEVVIVISDKCNCSSAGSETGAQVVSSETETDKEKNASSAEQEETDPEEIQIRAFLEKKHYDPENTDYEGKLKLMAALYRRGGEELHILAQVIMAGFAEVALAAAGKLIGENSAAEYDREAISAFVKEASDHGE